MKIKELTRKQFLKTIGISLTVLVLLLWKGLVNNIIIRRKKEKIYLPGNPKNSISFTDEIIIIKNDERLTVFSSKCTHLGCKINNQIDNELICPCHGSRFNENGIPINGPAVEKLKKLTVYKDKNNGKEFVYVS